MNVSFFDTPIERYNTDSLKFDRALSRHRRADLLPLWVADMDFAAPSAVLDALASRVEHGIFGYTEPGSVYFDAVCCWLRDRHGITSSEEEFVVTPGVVFALAQCVHAYTQPGDAVLIQPPVYYPFTGVVTDNNRQLVEAPLRLVDTYYDIDFDAFASVLDEKRPKLFLLCNPHNPVGRVWHKDELVKLAELCAQAGTIVVSDEIHMDFIRPGHTHSSFAVANPEHRQNMILCTSASKTFNLAGLQVANIIIPNESLRAQFCQAISASGYSQPNTLGLVATQAAYEQGASWLDELLAYLEINWALVEKRLAPVKDLVSLIPAEGTYLSWIDCRNLQLSADELTRFVEDEAGLWLDGGHMFGQGGTGFIRINIATQTSYLDQALTQLVAALNKHF